MDCNKAEDLNDLYLLGALDSRDRLLMESHLDSCHRCSLRLQGDGETVSRLAFAVPQVEVPTHVKQRLLAKIDADLQSSRLAQLGTSLLGRWGDMGSRLFPHAGVAVTTGLFVVLVFGGVWFNNRLDQVSEENDRFNDRLTQVSQENERLNKQVAAAAQREADVMEMVTNQRYLTYETMRMGAMRGATVRLLWGSEASPSARGMMVVSRTESRAVLLALNLPPLPDDKAYQVWLIKDGLKYSGGLFKVDSTGYGQAVIIPVVPFTEIDALGITIEPARGSTGPTGASVLKGDL